MVNAWRLEPHQWPGDRVGRDVVRVDAIAPVTAGAAPTAGLRVIDAKTQAGWTIVDARHPGRGTI